MCGARPTGPTGSLWDPIDIQWSHCSSSSSSSFYPASEESVTAWSSFNGKISTARGTSEWFFDVASRLYESAHSLRAFSTVPSTICLLYLSALVRLFPLSPFSSLSNVSPFFHFDHLHSRVCVQQKFRGYGAFIPCLVEPTGSSRIKLDNKPRSVKETKIEVGKEQKKNAKINTGRKRTQGSKRQ